MTGEGKGSRRALAAIWAAAILLNASLLFLYYRPQGKALAGDEQSYIDRALNIARGVDGDHLHVWPPGYDHFLSLPLAAGEAMEIPYPYLPAQLLQVLLWIVCGTVFWEISSRLMLSRSTRVLALALFILNPTLAAYSHFFWPEIPHLAAYLIALWIIMVHPESLAWSGVAGLLLALSSLLKLVYLPVTLLLFVLMLVMRSISGRRLAPAAVSPLLYILLLTPTLAHNVEQHRTLMIADSSIFNIWVGLNDRELTDWSRNSIVSREFAAYLGSADSHNERNGIYLKKVARLLKEQGIVRTLRVQAMKQYFRLFDHRTFFTKQLPGGMNRKYRFSDRRVAAGLRMMNDALWAMTLLGFGVGIMLQLNRSLSWMKLLAAMVAYNLVLFLFIHVKTRYVIQFLPMLCLVAAAGLNCLYTQFLSRRRGNDPGRLLPLPKLVAGLFLSGTLLILGFRDVLL